LCLKHLKTSIDRDNVAASDTFLQSWELSKCAEEFRAIEYQPCSISSVPTSGDITKYENNAEEVDGACIAPNSLHFRDKLKQEIIVSFSLYGKSHSSGGKMQRLQDVDLLSDQTLRQLKDSFYCGGGGRGRGSTATSDPSDASIADEQSYFFIEGTFYATDTLLPKADGRASSGTPDFCHISAVKEWLLSDKHVTQPSSSSTEQHAQKQSNAASSRNAEVELSDVAAQTQDYDVDGEDTGVEDDARILAALRMCTESCKPRGRKVQKRQGSDRRTRIVSHGEEDAHSATACDVSSAIAPADNTYASSASAIIEGVDRGSNDATSTTAPKDMRKKSKVGGSRRSSRLKVPLSSIYDSWTLGMDDPDDDRCVSSEGATSSSSSSAALITTTAPVVPLPPRGKEKVKDKRPSRAVKAKRGSLADRPKCTEKRADPGLLELHGLPPDCTLDTLSLDIPISSLKLRAGVRYLYRHGTSTTCDCEHFFYVTDMHLYCPTANSPDTSQAIASHHMRDPPLRRMYPRQTFYAKAVAKKCAICLLWGASYIVFGDRLADKSPLLYCR
jgi:snRNA-activating protein complex (SNAPc), subunit 3